MSLQRNGLIAILLLLYIGAVWARMGSVGEPAYPYYTGESGTNFRQTHQIATRGALPQTDRRAAWPGGYSPSRVKANGAEHLTGFAYRLVRPFSDISEKRFAGFLTILFVSLLVFTIYDVTRKMWGCQAAGLWAAFLTAFSAPLIDVTNGKEYLHVTFAVVLVSFHIMAYLRCRSRSSAMAAIITGVTGFFIFTVWETAGLYFAGIGLLCLLDPALNGATRRQVLAAHLGAILLAGLLLPHLRAQRFVFAWPTVWLFVTVIFAVVRDRLPRKVPGWVYLGGAFAILVFLLRPIQSGGTEMASPLQYWFYRLRFITGKPEDPALLPAAVRILWTSDHAPLRVYDIFAFFFPLVFLAPPAIGALREIHRQGRPLFLTPVVFLLFGVAICLFEHRAIPFAALLVFPFFSGAFRGVRQHLRSRALPIGLSALLVVTASPLAMGKIDTNRAIARFTGIPLNEPAGFMWVSIGNADREVVRHLVSRTSSRNDVLFALPNVSSLLVTFAGRATVLAPGVYAVSMTQKIADTVSRFYGDEEDLYTMCETVGATHVLYSVDLILDSTVYSPRYAVGLTGVDESSVALMMHFAPETLKRFHLVYENDSYRLFQVVSEPKPLFLTDHPPVYQHSILRVHGDDLDSFYDRVIDVLAAYQLAVDAQVRGDEGAAIRRFTYCLDQAPFFTKARLGIGDSLLRLDDPQAASDAYGRVLEYSPDNRHALYWGAFSLGSAGRSDEAVTLLDLLLSSTADRETRSRALELKTVLENGRPIELPR